MRAGASPASTPRRPPIHPRAAGLAATFSKGRQADKVPVDYTLRKYVKKPGGAKPGFVIYTHQQTLFVSPDEKLAKRLSAEDKAVRA